MKQLSKLLLCLLPIVSYALDSDSEQPMYFESDTAEINQKTGIGIYQGNVRIDQGSSHLTAVHATTTSDENNKLIEATADGDTQQQAHYWTLTEADEPELHAHANRIEFYVKDNKIILIGNATVIQGEDSYHAPRIEYDILKEEVISPTSKDGRTTIIIHP